MNLIFPVRLRIKCFNNNSFSHHCKAIFLDFRVWHGAFWSIWLHEATFGQPARLPGLALQVLLEWGARRCGNASCQGTGDDDLLEQ